MPTRFTKVRGFFGSESWECTVRFSNGVEGYGTGKSKSQARRNAIADAKSKGGFGEMVVIGLVALALGAGI